MEKQRMKVLVVDDDEGARDSLKFILEDEYEVCHADGGRKALEIFSKMKPDLVFLDKIMPDMEGIEVLQRMKQVYPFTPVIILTAYSSLKDAAQAIQIGASDYIPKPFAVREIKEKAAELLRYGTHRTLDVEHLRQRWITRKRNIRYKFVSSAFLPTS